MSIRLPCLVLFAVLGAGCAVSRLPNTGFAEAATLERAMKRYYEAHASEDRGQCLKPYIDGLTQVAVVEDQPERFTVDARYLYRDRLKDDQGRGGFATECTGYAGRRFSFTKSPAGSVEVVEMTGERRS